MDPRHVQPYAALAAGYDVVMDHVDYETWAEYALGLIARHAPETTSVLELGCGTGTFALELQDLAPELTGSPAGFEYLATDASPEMVRVARAKARLAGRRAGNLRFDVADFLNFAVEPPVDAVLLLYDGLNYLLEEDQVAQLLVRIASALGPEGIAIIDQSTPANSINNAAYFGDEGSAEGFAYVRRSRYEAERALHVTQFELTVEGERFAEEHVQRAYSLGDVRDLIAASPLAEEAAYDGFSTDPASGETERVHWVLRKR